MVNNKISYQEAESAILKKMSNCEIMASFKIPSGYVFSMKPKNWDTKKVLAEPYFKVSFKGDISEYSPVMDPKEFREGMKNIIVNNVKKTN